MIRLPAPVFVPFGSGAEGDPGALPGSARRHRPLVFPSEGEVPVLSFPADPLLPFERDAEPLLRLHPFQSEAGREGAARFLDECEQLLREIVLFELFGTPAACGEGILRQLDDLRAAWARSRSGKGEERGSRIVRIRTLAEITLEAGMAAAGADLPGGETRTVAAEEIVSTALPPGFGCDHLVLWSPAAVERLGDRIGAVVDSARRDGCLAGVEGADLRWIAAGFHPARTGFDFAVLDLSPFLPSGEFHFLPVYHRSLGPFLSERDGAACLAMIEASLRVDTVLRLLGGEGLKRLAEACAVRNACFQARARARRETAPAFLGGSLLQTFLRGRPPVRVSGTEGGAALDLLLSP